jgi:opacity protein-like surface antigen
MKKLSNRQLISILLLSSSMSTASFAGDAFSGFYAGVAAGGSFLTGHEIKHFTLSSDAVADNNDAQSRHGISKNSFIGVLYAGYGDCFCWNTYLGAEAFIDVANRNDDNHVDTAGLPGGINTGAFSHKSNLKIHPVSYGIDLRPGYRIADCTLLYARLGFAINTIRANTEIGAPVGAPPRAELVNTNSKRTTRVVFRWGAGLEQSITECLALRVDYVYTTLGKISLEDTTARTAVGSISGNSQMNLANHAVTIGLSWYF